MARYEADHGLDSVQKEKSTEAEPFAAPENTEVQVAEGPVVNTADDRIKELIKVDKSLPYSMILDFISPKDGSIYKAIRDAVQKNDISDQSHLLFDGHHRKTAMAEYDSNARQQMGLASNEQSEQNALISNEESGCDEIQNRQAARVVEEEHLESDRQQQMRDDELLKDALIQALEEREALHSTGTVSQESEAALTNGGQLDLPSAGMANDEEPLFLDMEIPNTFDQFSDLFGEDEGNQQESDFDHQARENLFADQLNDMAWKGGPLF